MRVLDLFSGIGGFSLGLERAGMETVAFCEIDKFCQKVLKKHWPDIPIHDNIKELDGTQYRGTIDLICGGFPCQPFSTAGKRKGKADNRDLWPEMFRVIQEARPNWIICENVVGFIDMEYERTANDLEAEGYEIQPFIIPASAVGGPHHRARVWIVGNSQYDGLPASPQLRGNEAPSDEWRQEEQDEAGEFTGASFPDDVPCVLRGFPRESWPGYFEFGSPWRYWATEPGVGRVADGASNRVDRLKALGNAVVPQIPEILGKMIMEVI